MRPTVPRSGRVATSRSTNTFEPQRVVIIGAGIAGLATAALLAADGHEVTVLESQSEVGGRAGSWSRDGFRFDTGPSWYLMPEVFDHFFSLLGTSATEQLTLSRLDPAYRVYFERHRDPVDVYSEREKAIALFESIEPGAGDQLARYLDSAKTAYELSVRRFLYTDFRNYLPLVRSDVAKNAGTLLRRLSQPLHGFITEHVKDQRLQQILGYPAVFLGASPYTTPSIYHLMSHLDLTDGVLYPQGGFTELISVIRQLAEDAGATIRTNTPVRSIATETIERRGRFNRGPTARVKGVEVESSAGDPRASTDSGLELIGADIVVGAADMHHIETTMLPSSLQTFPQKYWDQRDPGPGALLLYLGVRGSLPQLEHHNLFFTAKWQEGFDTIFSARRGVPSPASIYVCKPSATEVVDEGIAPPGHENVFVLVPMAADPKIGPGGIAGDGDPQVEKIADRIIEQIAQWAGIDDFAERIVLRRTVTPHDFERELNALDGSALGPAHTLKQSAFFRTRNASKTVAGLLYAGSSTIPGIGLPMCLISAQLILKRLRGDGSTEPTRGVAAQALRSTASSTPNAPVPPTKS